MTKKKEVPIHDYSSMEEYYIDLEPYKYFQMIPENEQANFIKATKLYLKKLTWPSNRRYPRDPICCFVCKEESTSIKFHRYLDCFNYCAKCHFASLFDFHVDKAARLIVKEKLDIDKYFEGKKFICRYCKEEFPAERKRKFCNPECSRLYYKKRYNSEEQKQFRAAKREIKRDAKREAKLASNDAEDVL